jgi:hypothetical protein
MHHLEIDRAGEPDRLAKPRRRRTLVASSGTTLA